MVKKSSKKRKYFNSTVATAVVASTVLGVTPVGAADLNYSDVKATDYFYDSIKSLADRGIVKGFPDGLYKPYESVTRGQAAVMLANLLQLDTENVKNPGFTDVPTTHPYYGAIAALSAKGIINGYEDKTYRPSDPIKRQHIALIIANAFQLKAQNPASLPFTDVLPTYKEKVAALYENGVTSGTGPTTFNSNANVTRGQIATFIVKAEEATAYTELTIEGISNNTIQTNKGTYTSTSNTTTIFSTENTNALIGATVKVKIEGNQITGVNALTLNASGTASDPKVFNGKNAAITGLTINADNIQVKNLTVNADIQVTNKVATEFTLEKVVTKGQLIIGSTTNSVASTNTLFAAETTGPKINLIGTEVEGLHAYLNNLIINSDTKIPVMTIDVGVSNIQVAGEVGKVVINVNVKVELSGDMTIDELLVRQATELALKITGEVKQLIIENSSAKVEVGTDVRVETLTVPSNTTPQGIITNYNSVSKNISNIKDANGNTIDTPKGSSGGGRDRDNGGPTDTVAPNVSVISNIVLIGQNLSVQSNEVGTVYLTSSDTVLTTINDLEKHAIATSTVETANSYVKIDTKDLQEGKYQLYVADKANNISTVMEISLVDTPEEYIAGKIEELELLVYESVGEHDGIDIYEAAANNNKNVDEFSIEVVKKAYVILMAMVNYSDNPEEIDIPEFPGILGGLFYGINASSAELSISGSEKSMEELQKEFKRIFESIEFSNQMPSDLNNPSDEEFAAVFESSLKVAASLIMYLNEENTELKELDSEIVRTLNAQLPYVYVIMVSTSISFDPGVGVETERELLNTLQKYLFNEYFTNLFINRIFKDPSVSIDELKIIDSLEDIEEIIGFNIEEVEASEDVIEEIASFIGMNLEISYMLNMDQYSEVNEKFYKAVKLINEKYSEENSIAMPFSVINKISEDQFIINPLYDANFNTDLTKSVDLFDSEYGSVKVDQESTFSYKLFPLTEIEITTNDSIILSENESGLISLEVTDDDGSLSGVYTLAVEDEDYNIITYDLMVHVSDDSEIYINSFNQLIPMTNISLNQVYFNSDNVGENATSLPLEWYINGAMGLGGFSYVVVMHDIVTGEVNWVVKDIPRFIEEVPEGDADEVGIIVKDYSVSTKDTTTDNYMIEIFLLNTITADLESDDVLDYKTIISKIEDSVVGYSSNFDIQALLKSNNSTGYSTSQSKDTLNLGVDFDLKNEFVRIVE